VVLDCKYVDSRGNLTTNSCRCHCSIYWGRIFPLSEHKGETMSDKYTMSTTNVFSFKSPAYECPKHGLVNDGTGTLQLWSADGKLSSKHCMKCYQEWIIANIPEVKEVP